MTGKWVDLFGIDPGWNVDSTAPTSHPGEQVTAGELLGRDTAVRIQRLLRWITELVAFEHGDNGRSTVTDSELLSDARALATTSRLALGVGPTSGDVERDLRTLLGLIGSDPEAYRDDVDPDVVLGT